ncbi:glycoside hydrolase family 78 protein [Pedobacter panaciterrae]|jgi:Alpha-L-rhamnosidase N-terminal domain./Bacterial alpha-L-rhamnosidase.|uniref:alpha-L-rhamnosidase n=1 Tax=Pedobacter panaciterrae TaxID=363849 RepID=A0ABU8NKZ6_9SPHI|nr:glycoside hydrolase family 78 protein [Pedobacter panaciterrae]NQX52533.1 family 78 glycoside hydrolase catalytic domain [Pedobacter panaciterrae]
MRPCIKTLLQKCAVFGLLFAVNLTALAQKLSVNDLKVEHLKNPLAIETPKPRFSWKIISTVKNTLQSSYEIRVGTSKASVNAGKDLVWKGSTTGDQSVLIEYAGSELQSKKRYYWQVRVKDNHGNTSAWSEPGLFQMGIAPTDWTAKWITVAGKDSSARSPLFRKEFSLQKKVKSAIAYITAKGLYEANINGQRVSDTYFAPGWTSYKDHLQYQVYDITAALKSGANVLGVSLGNGWYKGRIGFGNQHNFYGDTRGLLMQVEVEYTDGTKESINTDESWKYTYGPIMASDIYDGEIYDARMEIAGWNNTGFKEDAAWTAVGTMEKGTEKLVAMSGPPVRKHEQFKALKVFKTPAGETVVDFGQNLVGWVMLKAKGTAGTKITLSHAEVLTKEGNFYTVNLRSAKAQDTYILKENTEQVFEPHFTFQGFRYVKVEGYPGELKTEDLTAVAVYSDMETTGKFSTSNAMLNQLQHNIQWGQKGNFVDVPTDCPQRDERLGWTGDAQAFANTAAYNMDVAGFFTKWLKDVKTDQQPNGLIPHVIPNVLGPNDGASAGWADVSTIIPWDMYVAYGDRRILETQYESMQKWVGYISSVAKNNLWNSGFHFGDWLFYRPNDDNDGRAAVTDKYLIAQTFYAHSTQLLINAAKVLGKQDDVAKYTALLAEIKAAFVKEYMTPTGRLVSGTQTAYVLALHFDMLPEELRAPCAERLVANVRDYGNHLTTGFLGTPYLCHVLTRFGHNNVAYDLLMQESYPSWLYPVKMGATTIWERWDGIKPDGSFQTPDMNSYNHYAYGAIGDWMYRTIAGINSVADQPGYKSIVIAPKPGGKITNASAELETVYGTVKSAWTLENGLLKLDVTVPANTKAKIVLPDTTKEIGSGSYHFESKI